MKYTKEKILPIVENSVSLAGVLKKLGLRLTGGNYSHIKTVINKFDIDTSHFLGKGANRGDRHVGGIKRTPEDILVLRSEFECRTHGQRLRKALIAVGIVDVCAKCGQVPIWNGKCLILIPDHKNGKFWDNRVENLELLCPNCHSQTDTFSGRNNTGM
jgi:Zn finger protein HypA/HybF involved in hydrogenase expression